MKKILNVQFVQLVLMMLSFMIKKTKNWLWIVYAMIVMNHVWIVSDLKKIIVSYVVQNPNNLTFFKILVWKVVLQELSESKKIVIIWITKDVKVNIQDLILRLSKNLVYLKLTVISSLNIVNNVLLYVLNVLVHPINNVKNVKKAQLSLVQLVFLMAIFQNQKKCLEYKKKKH
jgi:hypothetical protein